MLLVYSPLEYNFWILENFDKSLESIFTDIDEKTQLKIIKHETNNAINFNSILDKTKVLMFSIFPIIITPKESIGYFNILSTVLYI